MTSIAFNDKLKRCGRCRCFKLVSEFGPSSQRRDGLRSRCRPCHAESNAETRARNPEASREASRAWARNNPGKAKAKQERWVARNPGRVAELARIRRAKDPQKYRDMQKARTSNDIYYRLMRSVSTRVYLILKGKEGKSVDEIVGYSGEDLKLHLERQFLDGMSWNNYGEWHVDHIQPLSSFKISSADDPEVKRAWCLSNLRPLWAKDNLRKKDKRLFLL